MSTWDCERTIQAHHAGVTSLKMHANMLLSGSLDGTIKVWNTSTYACEHTLVDVRDEDEGDTERGVVCLLVHEDILLSGDEDSSIRAWDTTTWELAGHLQGHCRAIECMAMCEDVLLSGSQDMTIRAWGSHDR
jgi:WD40 repeat protein